MSKSSGKTSKIVTKTLAIVLSLAMVVTTLTVTGTTSSAAAGKVKKVKVTSPVVNGGKLVLKKGQKKRIKVSVTTSKKKVSKKVTYKTSNKKVAKIVKSKGKVYVKAVGKKGTAKITVTSKKNKKKKATFSVKIGTPIKKISVSKLTYITSVYHSKETNVKKRTTTTSKTAKYSAKTGLTLYTGVSNTADNTTTSYLAQLSVKKTPAKASVKSLKWTTKNNRIVAINGSTGKMQAGQKAGTTYIYAKTKDGTNKQLKIKVTVKQSAAAATPTPNPEKDSRNATTVEDFESYAVGTTWNSYTSGGYKSGTMTVVKDPENENNKVLKITYDGAEQAFDYAPVFNLTLPDGKTLSNYTAIRLKSRVIANTADSNYKKVYTYFDSYKGIKTTDFFATSQNDGDKPTGVDVDKRFGVNIPMAEGVDKNYNVPTSVVPGYAIQDADIIKLSPNKQYNNKVFPSYYADYASGVDKTAIAPGYSETETNASSKVGWQQNTVELNTDRIKAAVISDGDTSKDLLNRNQLDMVIGSTFSGSQGKSAADYLMTMYMDDIQMMSGTIALEKLTITGPEVLACGNKANGVAAGTASLEAIYEPKNSTQRDLTWSSSDETLAKVDKTTGKVTANDAGKEGNVTITATCNANPSVKGTITFKVESAEPATEDYNVLTSGTTSIVAKSDDEKAKIKSEIDTLTLANGRLDIDYNALNQSIVVDLGQNVNLNRYKGVEISGITPGAIAMEIYSSKLDMTQTKEKGADKDWWETSSGKTYPFYAGSSTYRFEAGAVNKAGLIAAGHVNEKGKAVANEETCRFSLNKLAKDCSGDWSSVRYIVLKTNNAMNLPAAVFDAATIKDNRKTFKYSITGLKFTTREVIEKDEDGSGYTVSKEDANVAASNDTTKAYYVDNVSETNPAETHKSDKDLRDFRYIKVITKDATKITLGLMKAGAKIDDTVVIGEDTGSGERAVYFPISDLKDVDINNVDAISVGLPDGGSVEKIQLVTGYISYSAKIAKYELVNGAEVLVTKDVYGTEEAGA